MSFIYNNWRGIIDSSRKLSPRPRAMEPITMAENYFYSLDGPLESTPQKHQMRVANLAGLPGLVRVRGGDPHALLERHNIEPHQIRDPDHYVDCKSVIELFEDCSHTLNDPLFGLDLAEIQNPEVFGCVAALCRAAPTVRSSIDHFIEYIPVTHAPDTVLELIEKGPVAELRWNVPADLGSNAQANFQAVLLNLKLLREVVGQQFRPSYVNLAVESRAAGLRELERRLGARFNSTKTDNAIAFPTALLEQPVKSANKLLFKLLGGYLQKVKLASRESLAERVEDYVRGAMASGNCSIERCAMKLNMPVRTLQAQLAASELKFSDILESQRSEKARACLEQRDLSLDDVAEQLGYAEQSSFGRAFKRWTGLTPQQYRQGLDGSR